ncbi:hypothetical protein NU195Hw_g3588t1 [Hortaea werneckii]
MEASPFARLSAELRNQIWTYALSQPRGFYLVLQNGGYKLSRKRRQIALITTCRQINAETALLLYYINKFTFSASAEAMALTYLPHLEAWLRKVGSTNSSAIAEICFDFRSLPATPWRNSYKRSLGQVFDIIPAVLPPGSYPCKSLTALTATFHVDEGRYYDSLTFELPLIDTAEAVRRVEQTFDAEADRVMQLWEPDDEEIDVEGDDMFGAWAAEVADETCATLNIWKDSMICAIKKVW